MPQYCLCRSRKSAGFMIACDNCDEWFHGDCVKITRSESKNFVKYYCQACREKNPSLQLVLKGSKRGPQITETTKRRIVTGKNTTVKSSIASTSNGVRVPEVGEVLYLPGRHPRCEPSTVTKANRSASVIIPSYPGVFPRLSSAKTSRKLPIAKKIEALNQQEKTTKGSKRKAADQSDVPEQNSSDAEHNSHKLVKIGETLSVPITTQQSSSLNPVIQIDGSASLLSSGSSRRSSRSTQNLRLWIDADKEKKKRNSAGEVQLVNQSGGTLLNSVEPVSGGSACSLRGEIKIASDRIQRLPDPGVESKSSSSARKSRKQQATLEKPSTECEIESLVTTQETQSKEGPSNGRPEIESVCEKISLSGETISVPVQRQIAPVDQLVDSIRFTLSPNVVEVPSTINRNESVSQNVAVARPMVSASSEVPEAYGADLEISANSVSINDISASVDVSIKKIPAQRSFSSFVYSLFASVGHSPASSNEANQTKCNAVRKDTTSSTKFIPKAPEPTQNETLPESAKRNFLFQKRKGKQSIIKKVSTMSTVQPKCTSQNIGEFVAESSLANIADAESETEDHEDTDLAKSSRKVRLVDGRGKGEQKAAGKRSMPKRSSKTQKGNISAKAKTDVKAASKLKLYKDVAKDPDSPPWITIPEVDVAPSSIGDGELEAVMSQFAPSEDIPQGVMSPLAPSSLLEGFSEDFGDASGDDDNWNAWDVGSPSSEFIQRKRDVPPYAEKFPDFLQELYASQITNQLKNFKIPHLPYYVKREEFEQHYEADRERRAEDLDGLDDESIIMKKSMILIATIEDFRELDIEMKRLNGLLDHLGVHSPLPHDLDDCYLAMIPLVLHPVVNMRCSNRNRINLEARRNQFIGNVRGRISEEIKRIVQRKEDKSAVMTSVIATFCEGFDTDESIFLMWKTTLYHELNQRYPPRESISFFKHL